MGRVKIKPQLNQGKNFKVKDQQIIEVPDYDYPIFCFKHLHREYGLDRCEIAEKKALIEHIIKISQLSWQEIQHAPKHGLGSEKIHISSLKTKCPSFITEEVEFLLALRFDGKKPFLGHRNKFIFHVIFIDRDFTLYNH